MPYLFTAEQARRQDRSSKRLAATGRTIQLITRTYLLLLPFIAWAEQEGLMSYARFGAMIATATLVMFGLMYLNTYSIDHIAYSQTRTWMALIMGAVMAVVMIGFMWKMYGNRRANIGIIIGASILAAGSLWLLRSQETVYDVSFMKAMIPHHSIAIMTSERAHIRDPRVRELADRIIEAQVREIGEMKALIADLERSPVPEGAPDLPSYRQRGAAAPE